MKVVFTVAGVLSGLNPLLKASKSTVNFDGICCGFGAQILFLVMEMHRSELGSGGIHHVGVQGLRLIDVGSTVCCQIQDQTQFHLPDGLVEILQILRQIDALNAAVVGDELYTHLIAPKDTGDQTIQQMPVHLHKLPGEHSPGHRNSCRIQRSAFEASKQTIAHVSPMSTFAVKMP